MVADLRYGPKGRIEHLKSDCKIPQVAFAEHSVALSAGHLALLDRSVMWLSRQSGVTLDEVEWIGI